MRGWSLAVFLTLLALSSGCGEPEFYEVTGSVTLDEVAVPDGDVVFVPEKGAQFGPDAGKIVNGRYTAKVRKGKKKVEIRAVRDVPGKKGPMGEQLKEGYIPDRYNDKTILEADIGPGKTAHDFPLKSK